MTELLTRTEYAAIAAGLDIPRSPFIDGKFRPGQGEPMLTRNPADGSLIGEIAACGATDVDLAVGRARDAFENGTWSRRHPAERKDVLIRLCKLIMRNRRELAVMECLDSGKPIRDCVLIDLPETINTLKWHAEAIDKIYDQSAPVGDEAMAVILREPVGVVAAILPWNFPLLMLAWKIGPALAAGNSVIVKPAEQTSLTALRIAELAHEAGVPPAVLQVLPGTGPIVGGALGLHMDVDMVSFTGSTETGRIFLRHAADSNLKKIVLECGGKNPAIVLEDAADLDLVAGHLMQAAFWNMGENCSANSRLIVHRSVREPLLERLLARLREWKTGDPLDPVNHLGALVDAEHCKKVAGYLRKLKPLAGGEIKGTFVTPAIVEAKPGEAIATEEVFGPVLAVLTVESDEEAIALANDTQFGLTASIFTSNIRRALGSARRVRAGTVTVNCYGEGDITTPFGGYKQSGFGGRDNGLHAHDQYTELKTIWVDLTDPIAGDRMQ